MRKIISFIVFINFLCINPAYPDNLRVPLASNPNVNEERDYKVIGLLRDIDPPSPSIEPVDASYELAMQGKYDLAYDFLMEGLLGEGNAVNRKIAIGVSEALSAYYGEDSEDGETLIKILEILDRRYRPDHSEKLIKSELMQALGLIGADDIDYFRIASWIRRDLAYKIDIKYITEALKQGKVLLKYSITRDKDITVNIRRGIITVYEKEKDIEFIGDQDFTDGYSSENRYARKIPERILRLAWKRLGIEGFENTIELWKVPKEGLSTRLKRMTEDDIGICLRLLGKDVPSEEMRISKEEIADRLLALQRGKPRIIPLIQKKALELLEIDEDNFIEAVGAFIGDYILIRDEIRRAGIADDTATFYNIFDSVSLKKEHDLSTLNTLVNEAIRCL